MNPPPSFALSFCPTCGNVALLLHAISEFQTPNYCARDGTLIEVAIYKFERRGTQLAGNLLQAAPEDRKARPMLPAAAKDAKSATDKAIARHAKKGAKRLRP